MSCRRLNPPLRHERSAPIFDLKDEGNRMLKAEHPTMSRGAMGRSECLWWTDVGSFAGILAYW